MKKTILPLMAGFPMLIPLSLADRPYIHARAAVGDGALAYLGSISLSADAIAFNRETGRFLRERALGQELQAPLECDYHTRTRKF